MIPGTLRDSLFILEGLLEHQTSLNPHEVMSDTAGYSDVVFGLFWLLGYQFSPRLADLGEARFWRIDATADYGVLDQFNWSGSGGSWNAVGNWNLGSKPQNAGDVAILGGSLALAATVTLDGAQKVGGLIFANSNSSTTGYTLSPGAGGTLTLDNSGATAFLTVMSGSHSITAPLLLADNVMQRRRWQQPESFRRHPQE